eukprot:4518644-Alexandrium_andersonii.AAC.1
MVITPATSRDQIAFGVPLGYCGSVLHCSLTETRVSELPSACARPRRQCDRFLPFSAAPYGCRQLQGMPR